MQEGKQLRSSKLWLVLCCLLVLANREALAKNSTKVRIVGGQETSIGRVPYLVNLRVNGIFICGGTLVGRRYVVTAAHCVKNVLRRSLTVVGGTSLLSRRGVRRSVSKILIPSEFRMSNLQKDVAVLKLSSSMRGNNIQPIKLCNRSWRAGMLVKVSGWGLTNETANFVPNRVRTVRVPLISKRRCVRQYSAYANLTNSMFCAGVPGSQDSCSGDSGGPVIYRGRLCGVVSWGIGCARRNFPGVYTNIRKVRRFIRKAMTL